MRVLIPPGYLGDGVELIRMLMKPRERIQLGLTPGCPGEEENKPGKIARIFTGQRMDTSQRWPGELPGVCGIREGGATGIWGQDWWWLSAYYALSSPGCFL